MLARSSSDDPIDLLTASPVQVALPTPPPVLLPHTSPRNTNTTTHTRQGVTDAPIFPDSLRLRPGQTSGSGSGSGSSSGSSSTSSILSGGRFFLQSRQSSPATSRSNSAQDPLEHADRHESPIASAKVLGKRKADGRLVRPLGPPHNDTAQTSVKIVLKQHSSNHHHHEGNGDDGALASTVPPLEEPIFPITLYNSAYRFFPACNPSSSKLHPAAHPPAETQCPWVVQEGAWGKEAIRCGREFTSPDMLARHVLLTHCHIDCPESAPSSAIDLGTQIDPLSKQQSSSASAAPKVPCRYGSCSHRTFTSTEKMRAHVVQIHLVPAFLYLCPFENCRLPYNEQPDTQHKLEGHIDRIHDEEKEQLRQFARVGGIGPKGGRFSLLRSIPHAILDKNKGGVQPAAAWAYMIRAAAVSGIDLETAGQSSAVVEPPSGGFGPGWAAGPTSGRSFASALLGESGNPEMSLARQYKGTGLNDVEEEGALKLNQVPKVTRISSIEIGGHWLHQPQARRPPLPGKATKAKPGKGSPSKSQSSSYIAIVTATRDEIVSRRAADAARLQKKGFFTPSQRSIIEPPQHAASSQTVLFKPSRVQPYVSLIGKMSYLQTPATPLVPSETMLRLAPPPTSSKRAGDVYARRHAKMKEEIVSKNVSIDVEDGTLHSRLPKRQVLLDVFLDRPERTLAVEGREFVMEGMGSFDCVEIPRRWDINPRDFGIHQAKSRPVEVPMEAPSEVPSEALIEVDEVDMVEEQFGLAEGIGGQVEEVEEVKGEIQRAVEVKPEEVQVEALALWVDS
ncbi:hypothetical protein A4X13_0g3503 [Tilletia indica]|uniref:Uncharacterized protein n=1 Tax=Tilletia indica TaxID=43049 RepID=A0A177TBJ5_9BASI|nr:hypothetical protein A4X13_0g3503 [Tilletia indica]